MKTSNFNIFHSILLLLALSTAVYSCKRADNEAPVLRLQGPDVLTVTRGSGFLDPGVIAFDDRDYDVSETVVKESNVNSNVAGQYQITYTATDKAGNSAQIVRQVTVVHSAASLAGTYKSSNNCQFCPASASALLEASTVYANTISITRWIGPNNDWIRLQLGADGSLTFSNYGGYACSHSLRGANGTVSADGNRITLDVEMVSQLTNARSFCTIVYTKQ